MLRSIALALLLAAGGQSAVAQLVISGNENKIDLTSGKPQPVSGAEPDSLSLLDFSEFPPNVRHVKGISNSVIGPPSNIAITPDGRIALVASSLVLDPQSPAGWSPDDLIHVVDLTTDPPQVVDQVHAGRQPSGISITPDGRRALVANRAGGTVSVLAIDGSKVTVEQEVEVCEAAENASDVAITPDGRRALVSVNLGGYLRLLEIGDDEVTVDPRKISAYGMPYRTLITPDGKLGLTAGAGQGGAPDNDALTIVDLAADVPRTIDYVTLGAGPESIELSPDGNLLAAVLMNGSNLADGDPLQTDRGKLVILERRGQTFVKSQELPIDRIPEGVAFTADGRYLLVQCHPDRQIWVLAVDDGRVEDTHERIDVPGMPSSIRAAGIAR